MAVSKPIVSKWFDCMRNGVFCDFTVRVGASTFQIHKFVIANRSPYFKALFESSMRESVEMTLNLEDVEEKVFGLFLEFVYTGKFANVNDFEWNASKLIYCAAKYQTTDLFEKCEKFLRTSLLIGDVASSLVTADLLELDQLMNEAFAAAARDWDCLLRSNSSRDLISNHRLASSIENRMIEDLKKSIKKNCDVKVSSDSLTWRISESSIPVIANHCMCTNVFFLPIGKSNEDADECDSQSWMLKLVLLENNFISFHLIYASCEIMPSCISCDFKAVFSYPETHHSGVFDRSNYDRVQTLLWKSNVFAEPAEAFYIGDLRAQDSIILTLNCKKFERDNPIVKSLHDFGEYLESRQFADGEIVVKGESFKVHKLIFSSVSSVFESGFAAGSQIANENVDPAVFRCWCNFIYASDSVPQPSGADVLRASYCYGLCDELMNKLRSILVRQFDFDNVIPILQLAHEQNDSELVDSAIEFIFLHFESLSSMPQWNAMQPSLHGAFIRFLATQLKKLPTN